MHKTLRVLLENSEKKFSGEGDNPSYTPPSSWLFSVNLHSVLHIFRETIVASHIHSTDVTTASHIHVDDDSRFTSGRS